MLRRLRCKASGRCECLDEIMEIMTTEATRATRGVTATASFSKKVSMTSSVRRLFERYQTYYRERASFAECCNVLILLDISVAVS